MKIAITGTTSGIGQAIHDKLNNHNIVKYNRPQFNLLDDDCLNNIDLSKIDVLVNNAGADYKRTEYIKHRYEDWYNTVKINLIVPMFLTQRFIKQNTNGIIINITSTGAIKMPTTESSVFYRSSKQALKHYTNEINETQSSFRVVEIEPGKTATNFIKNAGCVSKYNKQCMSPENVAQAVEFAINTSYITHITLKYS